MLVGMQGGIIFSNAVTTVSPTYAREALEGGAAGWLRATLAKPEVRSKFKVGLPVPMLKATSI
jgi:starch synthase